MTELEALRIVATEAQKLVDAVTHDDSGSMVAGQWVGGDGGLLTRETLLQNDRVRLALDGLKQAEVADAPRD